MTNPQKNLCLLLATAFAAWAVAWMRWLSFEVDNLRYFTLHDDAFISMRYGWNLAHGLGPVWNAGERVEGYTNPLQMLLMAGAIKVHGVRLGVALVQLMGAAEVLAAAWLAGMLARRLSGSAGAQILAFAACLACAPLARWSLLGHEAALVALCLLSGALLLGDGRRCSGALALALAYLARPDALLPAAAMLALMLPWRRWAAPALILGASVAAHLAWRFNYYGALSPNTYTLKVSGFPLDVRSGNGWRFLASCAPLYWPLWLGAVLSVLLSPTRARRALLAVPLASLLGLAWLGGDVFGPTRLTAATLPFLIVLCVDAAFASNAFGVRVYGAVCLAAALALVAIPDWPALSMRALPEESVYARRWTTAALKLAPLMKPGEAVGVTWAGCLPYYLAPRPAVDYLGKCDRHVAALAPDLSPAMRAVLGHNKYDLAYSIDTLKPAWCAALTWGADQRDRRDDFEPLTLGEMTIFARKGR